VSSGLEVFGRLDDLGDEVAPEVDQAAGLAPADERDALPSPPTPLPSISSPLLVSIEHDLRCAVARAQSSVCISDALRLVVAAGFAGSAEASEPSDANRAVSTRNLIQLRHAAAPDVAIRCPFTL